MRLYIKRFGVLFCSVASFFLSYENWNPEELCSLGIYMKTDTRKILPPPTFSLLPALKYIWKQLSVSLLYCYFATRLSTAFLKLQNCLGRKCLQIRHCLQCNVQLAENRSNQTNFDVAGSVAMPNPKLERSGAEVGNFSATLRGRCCFGILLFRNCYYSPFFFQRMKRLVCGRVGGLLGVCLNFRKQMVASSESNVFSFFAWWWWNC